MSKANIFKQFNPDGLADDVADKIEREEEESFVLDDSGSEYTPRNLGPLDYPLN